MDFMISVTNLNKSFKEKEVLKGVTFNVKKGSIFALLGSNGAGKTTTINILSTLAKADAGEVKINGNSLSKNKNAIKQSISLTGQYATVDGLLTGRENLQLIARLKRMKKPHQAADQLLEKFNLIDAADKLANTYSGGMRRRLDIAMSLIGNPQIIFLDEPTTGLDPQNRLAMWEMVKELSNSGITIILTTQYIEEAEALANDIAILHDGKIIKEGTPEELKSLLPTGRLILNFHHHEDRKKAIEALSHYRVMYDEGCLTKLSILADNDVATLTDVLVRLQAASINVENFKQDAPSLEDAFLSIIGHKKGEN